MVRILFYGLMWPFVLFSQTKAIPKKNDSLLTVLVKLNQQGRFKTVIKYLRTEKKNVHTSNEGQFMVEYAKAFEGLNTTDSAFFYYTKALRDFENRDIPELIAETNLEISDLLETQNNLDIDHSTYFEKFWDYATTVKNPYLLGKGHNYLGRKTYLDGNPVVPLRHFDKAYEYFKQADSTSSAVTNLMNMGAVYSYRIEKNDSARYYYFRAMDLLKSYGVLHKYSNKHHDLLNNIGNTYRRDKKYLKALEFYKQAETLRVKKYQAKTKKILYGNMDAAYYYLGDFENAYNYLFKYDSIKDEIGLAEQNSTISDIQEKYNNEKLRADNLESEKRRIRNRNWLIASGFVLFLGGGIALLLQKNTTKKRQLAEQEAILKQQRVDNLLKEQELVSIDAMIAGQEKERQKVAGELHDDLGSLMATIKLHFDKANTDTSDPALEKAQNLLEEAYQKIRGMAHSKNSGVMSDQGLLSAIKKMAKTISETNAMEVEVEHFGLGERMENSLELSIFRIIQELVANAIKHAEASKINIQLTQHEENLNIIVEDNGKGFDRSQLGQDSNGMGLTNIEKRVEHLEGNFTVDSVMGKGTSILIDIPV